MRAIDCEFDIGGFYLRGKRWGTSDGFPVLALHGWLDNCASFDFLAPLFPQLNLIALDLAGHGLSDHRKHLGAYNIWQDVGEVFAVADHLGWSQFGLLGHSRGAVIAMLAAGTFPERIAKLAMVEGIRPFIGAAESAPEVLADSIANVSQQVRRPRRFYPSFLAAVTARENGMFALSHQDALALAQRGVIESAEGFAWLYDNKLMAKSEMRLTCEQIEAFLSRIACPSLLVSAEKGLLTEEGNLGPWLKQHPQIPRVQVPGSHHCHMSDYAVEVAHELNARLW
jgi:pimeloyl-ACP methyl ester carboxylesterase